jgi:error-prone DNA polymerase
VRKAPRDAIRRDKPGHELISANAPVPGARLGGQFGRLLLPRHHRGRSRTSADLLFERFVSVERNEPPDIDVDFEHERREEVIQYIYEKYGRTAPASPPPSSPTAPSAVREVGKASACRRTRSAHCRARSGAGRRGVPKRGSRGRPRSVRPAPCARSSTRASEMIGFPRHLSQHVGGFVITRDRLDEIVPIANAAMEEPHHRRMGQGRSRRARHPQGRCAGARHALLPAPRLRVHAAPHYGWTPTIASIRRRGRSRRSTAMIQRADTLGVFQIESRAQMSMLPRLRPENSTTSSSRSRSSAPARSRATWCIPICAGARAREGRLSLTASRRPDELEHVLDKTLGVPLFQEQAMRIAIVAAGFTPGEADQLRRAMATFKRVGTIDTSATR